MRPHCPLPAAVVGAALVVAWAAAGCSSSTGGATGAGTTAPAPGTPTTTAATTAPADPADQPGGFRLYWMRDCAPPETAGDITTCRVGVGAARQAPAGADGPRAALDALLAGPSPEEEAAGLHSNLRRNVTVYDYSLDGDGTATVDLSRYFETAKTRPQVAQVVFTLTQFPQVKRVRFLIDHQPNGATGVAPQTRDDLADLTPAVLVESPTAGAALGPAVRLSGTAASPDGTVHYVVRDLAGATRGQGRLNIVATPGTRGRFGGTVAVTGAAGPVAIVLAPTDPGPPGAPVDGEVSVGGGFTP